MEKPKNLILNKIIPAILALGSIANLALLVASFLSKYNPGGLSAHSVTFLISSSPIVNSLFVILVISWIFFAIRNREMFKRDFNVLFGIILFVSYVTAYILFDTSYYIRDSAVDMSYKLEDLRPYLKSDQSKDDKEKNLQLAIADLKEIKDDIGKKTPAVVYYLLGKAYFEQKNFSESLKLYKEALDIKNLSRDKNTKDYEFNYATTSLYMCSPDSISLFEGYVEKYPNDITGLMSLAISYHVAYVLSNKLQDAEKAEEQYDRTISKIKERTSIEGAFIKDYYTKQLEIAYFMMGTLHARNFDLSRNDREIRISIENLGKSVEEAEKVSEDEVIHRLCIIKKAAYSPNGEACSDKKTDALTSLVAQPIFENWWSQRKHTVEGTQKCSK